MTHIITAITIIGFLAAFGWLALNAIDGEMEFREQLRAERCHEFNQLPEYCRDLRGV